MAAIAIALGFIYIWLRARKQDIAIRDRQLRLEEDRFARETEREKRVEASEVERISDDMVARGGYIVVDLSEKERSLFHDLLKGFEDYAKLKGYQLAFSIDTSIDSKIAFKFTIKNDGVVVGTERVRADFKEYLARVRSNDIDNFDDLPIITSLEEHNLLVTLLKNRISFLQHNYQLEHNAVRYYESLLDRVRTFPALPVPSSSVIVHTGGSMDSRSYNAINSEKVIQGDDNRLSDNSLNIGRSFNERQERIAALDDVLSKLRNTADKTEGAEKLERSLANVRDELAEEAQPSPSVVQKWMETAKHSLKTASLGYEATEAVKKLLTMFGV